VFSLIFSQKSHFFSEIFWKKKLKNRKYKLQGQEKKHGFLAFFDPFFWHFFWGFAKNSKKRQKMVNFNMDFQDLVEKLATLVYNRP